MEDYYKKEFKISQIEELLKIGEAIDATNGVLQSTIPPQLLSKKP
ncbi:hypothetical protein [Pedobacter glucosidilyticus]|nr:hypothetical protein [Pedobacter glucosidilyticus]